MRHVLLMDDLTITYEFRLADGKAVPWRLTFHYHDWCGWILQSAQSNVAVYHDWSSSVRRELVERYGRRQVVEAELAGNRAGRELED